MLRTTLLLIDSEALFDSNVSNQIGGLESISSEYRLIFRLRHHVLKSLYRLRRFGYELLLVFRDGAEKDNVSDAFKAVCLKEGVEFSDFLTLEALKHERFFQVENPTKINLLDSTTLHSPHPYVWVVGSEILGEKWFEEHIKANKRFAEEATEVLRFEEPPLYYQLMDTRDSGAIKNNENESKVFEGNSNWKLVKGSWNELCEQLLARERMVTIVRETQETSIRVCLNLDGSGKSEIRTGLHFLNHMLENFAKHAGFNLEIIAKGDLNVDEHHTIEDTALILGEALKRALGGKQGINRYAFSLPMDESQVTCLLDLSGRSYVVWKDEFKRERVGDFPTELVRHFYESLATAGGFNLHLTLAGENDHHQIEASFKALARCFREAVTRGGEEIPSTKGGLS